jgi:hypothetical protein
LSAERASKTRTVDPATHPAAVHTRATMTAASVRSRMRTGSVTHSSHVIVPPAPGTPTPVQRGDECSGRPPSKSWRDTYASATADGRERRRRDPTCIFKSSCTSDDGKKPRDTHTEDDMTGRSRWR